MNVQINAPFQLDERLQGLIDEKVGKLTTFFERIIETEVFLKVGEKRSRRGEEQTVELRIAVPGQTLFAEHRSDTFEESLAEAAEKARKQLLKYKAKL
jgi:putative sigma-54 modulation protein